MDSDSIPFMINIVSHVTVDSPYAFGGISFGDIDEFHLFNKLIEKYSRTLLTSRFCELTKFQNVDLFITIIAPDCRRGGLKLQEKRRDNAIWIISNHYWHEFPQNDEDALERVVEEIIKRGLNSAFTKYSVPTIGLLPIQAQEDEDCEFSVDSECEIRIFLKLAGDKPLQDCLQANFEIIEELDELVQNQNLGRFDGSEVGCDLALDSDYETIFFVGTIEEELLNCCISFLQKRGIEPGSYLEFKSAEGKGTTTHKFH